MKPATFEIDGTIGLCGSYQVFLGFAPAKILYAASFADVLDEDSGVGYQRPRNIQHSVDFKKYISKPDASTIPLTFNLRSDLKRYWNIKSTGKNKAKLIIKPDYPCMAQVDCQHRLGEMKDSNISFAFMSFIGLNLRSEMTMFVVINSKAKGLSSSLTDFHQTNLVKDLISEAPQLYLARKLNDDPQSPWFKMIKLGGNSTSGLHRRTSLRMMQKAILKFLTHSKSSNVTDPDEIYSILVEYWRAVANVFPEEWQDHRHHLITKGIGLYSLMQLLSDLVVRAHGKKCDQKHFEQHLKLLRRRIDWKSTGMFAAAGGQKGALGVYEKLRKEMPDARLVG